MKSIFVNINQTDCYNFGTKFVKKKDDFQGNFWENAWIVSEMFIILQSFL